MLYADQTNNDPESVMQVNLGGTAVNFSSAGGFSNYFPQPSYQQAAVAEYFATAKLSYPYYSEFSVNVNTTKGLYNRIGRGYPDVASNGAYLPLYVQGELGYWFGTSLASPTFASILTLVCFSVILDASLIRLTALAKRGPFRDWEGPDWIRQSCSVRQPGGFD